MEQEAVNERLNQLEARIERLETENSRLNEVLAKNGIIESDYADEALDEESGRGRAKFFTIAGVLSLISMPLFLLAKKIRGKRK